MSTLYIKSVIKITVFTIKLYLEKDFYTGGVRKTCRFHMMWGLRGDSEYVILKKVSGCARQPVFYVNLADNFGFL